MKVVMPQLTENNASDELDAILEDIADIRAFVFEGKAGRSKAEAKAAKQKKLQQKAKASQKRGSSYDPEKAAEVEKKDAESKKKKVNTKLFGKSSTNFGKHKSNPDALVHDSALRKKMPASDFINPKKRTGPVNRGLASVMGTLRQAQEHGTPDELAKAQAAARKLGVKPHDKLSREREGCTPGSAGYTVRECKPHGKGGPDEWLRKATKKAGHRQEVRKKGFAGHARLPEQSKTKTQKGAKSTERAHAVAGGHAGEKERGFFRTLGPHSLKKIGATQKTQGDVGSPLSGRHLRTLMKRNKSMQTK